MNILFVAPYIYEPKFKEHSKNKSGFGIMVSDIARSVAQNGNDVLVCVNAIGKEKDNKIFKIAGNSILRTLIHGNYRGVFSFNELLKKEGESLKSRLRNLYYYIGTGRVERLIKKNKPDIVHIHGCSTVIEEYIKVCDKYRVPCIITLHGLLEDDMGASKLLKKCEQQLIRKSCKRNIPVTVISSGMKKRVTSDYYCAENSDNIKVITNGINISEQNITSNIKEKLDIVSKKVILSVGNVCRLKNQMQIVRAFSKLPEEIKNNSVVILVGSIYENYPIKDEIKKLNLCDKVFCVGYVPRKELKNFYSCADVSVVASETEGFGLPIAEGYVYGIPSVIFSDLDAVDDLYDENTMILCEERTDIALAEAIEKSLKKKWDKKKIKEHSKRFSLECMARKYIDEYVKINVSKF